MRALFVNPFIYDFAAFDLWLRPLGLLYLVSIARECTDAEIYWLDTLDRQAHQARYRFGRDGRGKYDRQILEKPDIYRSVPRNYARYGMTVDRFDVALSLLPVEIELIFVTSLMTYWVDGVNFTISRLRNRFPKARIVIGGILPSLLKQKVSAYVDGDIFIEGSGERALLNILKEAGCKLSVSADCIQDIDRRPFPAMELLGEQRVLPLLTSRGCPFNCHYCASALLIDRFVERSADSIYREILHFHDRCGTTDFVIFDDAFLIHKKERFFKVFERLISNQKSIRFHTPNGIHAREIDRQTAEILYKSGFKTIRLSFEATDQSILKSSDNKVTVRQMEQAVENLLDAGYRAGEIEAYLLFGIHGQQMDSVLNSLDFVRRLEVIPRLSFYSPVPGTRDFLDLQKTGVISDPLNLYETNKTYFTYVKSGLSAEEIKLVKDETLRIEENIVVKRWK